MVNDIGIGIESRVHCYSLDLIKFVEIRDGNIIIKIEDEPYYIYNDIIYSILKLIAVTYVEKYAG